MIEKIKEKLLKAVKIPLETGLTGFESPGSYGIYRDTGGNCLGVVGETYQPIDLNIYLNSIVKSLSHFSTKYDLEKLNYNEYRGGRKISLDIETKEFEVKSPLVGDTFKTMLSFQTGFDGLTKSSITFKVLRLVCTNGAKSWKNDLDLSYKNTFGNQGKIIGLVDEIVQIEHNIEEYQSELSRIAQIKFSKSQVNEFYTKLLGYSEAEYVDLPKISQNRFDKIQESVAIEEKDLGMTPYTLLQGITRYNMTREDSDSYLYGAGEKMNKLAHQLLLKWHY